jgi:excisionase family DNA binding protein
MEPIADRVISASINEFCVLSGLGRTKVYELLDAGELRSIHVGKRRLVLIDSYRELIKRQEAAGQERSEGRPRRSNQDRFRVA